MIEWWSYQTSAWIGAIGGSGLGVLGGVLGTAASMLVSKGKGRAAVLGGLAVCACAGALTLVTGVVALGLGQPYHVYYPLLLLGGIASVVMGSLLPVMRTRYRQAEQRRMDANLMRDR